MSTQTRQTRVCLTCKASLYLAHDEFIDFSAALFLLSSLSIQMETSSRLRRANVEILNSIISAQWCLAKICELLELTQNSKKQFIIVDDLELSRPLNMHLSTSLQPRSARRSPYYCTLIMLASEQQKIINAKHLGRHIKIDINDAHTRMRKLG